MNFGTDLLIVDGEIIWDGDELATVSGEDNVNQQAYLRLMTDLGENPFFPDYGSQLQTYMSKTYTLENKQKAEEIAKAALLRVGDENGLSWIEQVLDCQLLLTQVEGKTTKVLFAKYKIRGLDQPQELNYVFKG
jgi:phage baseplate assembly protein W